MKHSIALFFVTLIIGCTTGGTLVSIVNVNGTWTWKCCAEKYHGKMELTVDAAEKISGRFFDTSNGTGGIIEGVRRGNLLLFSRTWEGLKQTYRLRVSDDGKKLTGDIDGDYDKSTSVEFSAVK